MRTWIAIFAYIDATNDRTYAYHFKVKAPSRRAGEKLAREIIADAGRLQAVMYGKPSPDDGADWQVDVIKGIAEGERWSPGSTDLYLLSLAELARQRAVNQ